MVRVPAGVRVAGCIMRPVSRVGFGRKGTGLALAAITTGKACGNPCSKLSLPTTPTYPPLTLFPTLASGQGRKEGPAGAPRLQVPISRTAGDPEPNAVPSATPPYPPLSPLPYMIRSRMQGRTCWSPLVLSPRWQSLWRHHVHKCTLRPPLPNLHAPHCCPTPTGEGRKEGLIRAPRLQVSASRARGDPARLLPAPAAPPQPPDAPTRRRARPSACHEQPGRGSEPRPEPWFRSRQPGR